MGTLKSSVGSTQLEGTGLLDSYHLQKLRALSITTVEELLGLIAADIQHVGEFLEVSNLPLLQADAVQLASAPLIQTQERVMEQRHAMGARNPERLLVEETVSQSTFDSYFSGFQPGYLAGSPGSGRDLRRCFGPIRSQGDRGTCVAHAGCALRECLHHTQTGSLIDLSPQFLYWNAKQLDGHPNLEGTWLEVAVPSIEQDGVCLESIWPYNPAPIPGDESQGPPPGQAQAYARSYQTNGSQELDSRSSSRIMQVLDTNQPVAISVPVYNNWYLNPNTNAFGFIPLPLPNSILSGGHAMCAVGYDYDDELAGGGYFILRNSWGTDWAASSPIEPGYGIIPFLYIDTYGWEAYTCS